MNNKITILALLILSLLGNNVLTQDSQYYNHKYNEELLAKESGTQTTPITQCLNYVAAPRQVVTPIGTFLININYIIHPSLYMQNEVIIKRSPVNPNIMFASSIAGPTIGAYVTTNGGLSWYGTDSVSAFQSVIHGSDPGVTIDKNGVLIITSMGGFPILNNPNSIIANYSTNNGLTFSPTVAISSNTTIAQDKEFIWTDDVPGSPFYGRSYIAWTDPSIIGSAIKFVYTTNSGMSWSSEITISPQNTQGSTLIGCDGDVGPNGQVYVVWAKSLLGESTEDSLGFASSTDGGVTWYKKSNGVLHMMGIRTDFFYPCDARVNGFPRIGLDKTGGSRNGWIYVVGSEKTPFAADSSDIYLFRSRDGGVNWDSPIRVNQDTPGNGKKQYFAAVCVDDSGGVNVVYYDNRNTSYDSAEIYISRSTNGGATWADILVSDHRFRPKPVSINFMGDYIGITSANHKLWPIWMEDVTDRYQAWTTSISILTGIQPLLNELPLKFTLQQNYPNPFNPSTSIDFDLPKSTFVNLSVYDISGKKVNVLVNEDLKPGHYRVNFDGSKFSSGVYFYKLITNEFMETKRMVLLK